MGHKTGVDDGQQSKEKMKAPAYAQQHHKLGLQEHEVRS